MDKLSIGIVKIEYDKEGKVIRANFYPSMNLEADDDLKNQLQTIKNSDQETVKSNASLVMAAWFSKMTDIELADREKYEISTNIISCDKHWDGTIKMCVIEFEFKERA